MAKNQASSKMLQRKVISASGHLGDFYDMCRDCLVGNCNLASKALPNKSFIRTTQCVCINGDTNECRNLFRNIGMEDDLRLSLLLNLAPTVGIGAFLNHHREINAFTRILYYSYRDNEKYLSEKSGSEVKSATLMNLDANATHVISKMEVGIDALFVLQIPDDAIITQIDAILVEFCNFLSTDHRRPFSCKPKDKYLLQQLTNTTVTIYSNMPALTNIKKLFEIPQRIAEIKKKPHQCRPTTYYFRPITWLYPQYDKREKIFHILPSDLTSELENFLSELRAMKTNLEISFQDTKLTMINRHFKKHIADVRQQWSNLKEKYDIEIKRLTKLIIDFRTSQSGIAEIKKVLNDKTRIALENRMHELIHSVDDWKIKANLISDLRKDGFDYYNVVDHDVVKNDNEKDLERKLIKGHENERILCSNDQLNRNKSEQLVKLRSDLIEQRRKRRSNLGLIYADFSYSSYKLSNIMILSSTDTKTVKCKRKRRKKSSSIKKSPPSTSPGSSSPLLMIDDTINILLLGETGVGKSTFINALVNYLAFDSFEQARSNDPIVLITISFLITTGDNFEEHIIKFVDFDRSNNEDFDHPGQSVTQQCRSYVFPLRHSNGKKIRIIDTPGFGDTRGIDQDDLNIEHILRYINNLTHLNAICFLLKPNASRLNMFFRICLTQLFSLLGPNAQQNIIFCFTNARSTFYTPGDTAPLLKEMLRSLPMNNILFHKENAFCFDNESFRYLVALQNGVLFNEVDKHEYEMSWLNSVKESNRLLEYITTKLTAYRMQDGRPSIKHAQLEIDLLIRPILEAIRNILRNLILSKQGLKDQSIIMYPKPLEYSAARCLICKTDPTSIGPFRIITDVPHKIQHECCNCSCPCDQHIPINYVLEYELDDDESSSEQKEDMVNMLDQLCDATAEFAYFLMYIAHSTKEDPFFMGLIRMIMDENEFNIQLVKDLRKIQSKHEENMSKIQSNKKKIDLSAIYDLINTISELPTIDEQMVAVKQTQETLMEQYEYEVQKF